MRRRLIGLWPLVFPRTIFGSIVRTWKCHFSCSGAPLLDGARAQLSLNLMLAWLKDNNPRIDALDMPQLVRDGSACQLVHAHARGHGLSIGLLDRYERACLDATIIERGARDFISAKKRKDLLRQFRRLRERGAVSFGMASEGASLHERIEAFMALEAKGWKGRRKTAFLSSTAETKFLRTLAQSLAKQGKCRIYWLALDDRMVAANIVLLDGLGTAYFWKTAYDEDFGAYSPGVLLTMDMTDRFFREPGIVFGDSCAEPDHPMIDHMWRGRLKCVDALVSLQPDRRRAFIWALTLERLRRGLREAAKQAFACIRRH
jgi:CelD/BcsL family acetyltransferase involved in cellulose biosynthesis